MTTPLPFSPFIDIALVDPEHRFVLDEHKFLLDIAEDDPPLFIGAPSADFIAACRRDIVPIIEMYARQG